MAAHRITTQKMMVMDNDDDDDDDDDVDGAANGQIICLAWRTQARSLCLLFRVRRAGKKAGMRHRIWFHPCRRTVRMT